MSFLAFHSDVSSVLQDDLPYPRQPNAVAPDVSDISSSMESLKDVVQVILRYADALIRDTQDGPSRVILHDTFFKREVNRAATRAVLDRVVQQIAEHTIQTWAIPHAH